MGLLTQGLLKIVAPILFLGGLVFFHELGHFIVAKLCHVKVLKFSLGFGPRLWGFKRGETEYQLAAVPLGGYVKMLGDDPSVELPPEDRARGFSQQKPHRRALIAMAGPAMNLLLPVLVFFGMNLWPQLQEPPIVTLVLENEAAARAGVEPRDRIVSVDGVPTRSFEEMREAIETRAGRPIDLVVQRRGELKTLRVTPTSEAEHDVIETTRKGKIGIMSGKLPAYVAVLPGSRAAIGGLNTFDRILSINGVKLASIADLDDALNKAGPQSALTVEVIRGTTVDLKTTSVATEKILTLQVPAGPGLVGFDRADLYVREVVPGSPAAIAGLKPLDKIVAVAGTPVFSEMRLISLVDGKKVIDLQVDRAGQRVEVAFSPQEVTHSDPMMGPTTETEYGYRFHPGMHVIEPYAPEERVLISYPPAVAMTRAVQQTATVTRTIVLGIGALFTGRVSTQSIGGPIMLYQLASRSSELGLLPFLNLFALISINLGLMNLLPVPVLDGFHILLAGVEGISRRAVPMRVREVATYVGVIMLIALMALAFKNDVWFRVLGN